MREAIAAGLLIVGGGFSIIAAIGILRMPDVFTRMHASTKSGTVGVGFIMLASAVYFNDLGITTRAMLVVAFLVLTIPVAAHMIARAAYFIGEPLWEGSVVDEMRQHCDLEHRTIGCDRFQHTKSGSAPDRHSEEKG